MFINFVTFSSGNQTKPSLNHDEEASDEESNWNEAYDKWLNSTVIGIPSSCESCIKFFGQAKILHHIGNNKTCRTYYGPRFLELKRRKESDRK